MFRTRSPSMPDELHLYSISHLAELIRAKRVSPVELADHFLARIERLDGSLHSFITATPELARRQAYRVEAEIMRGEYKGLLHGIPFGLKDIYNTAGVRTTALSRMLADNVPSTDSTVTQKLYSAGAILLG